MSTAFLIFILLFSLNFFILFCMIYRILNNNILIYWNNFLYLKSFYLTSTCDVFYKLLTSIEKQGLALTKNRLRLFNPPAPQSWGMGFSFSSFSCIIDIWISYKESLLTIMNKLNILFIPDLLRWKILKKWLNVVILLLVVPCMAALTAVNLSSFLFVATAVSALPAAPLSFPFCCQRCFTYVL